MRNTTDAIHTNLTGGTVEGGVRIAAWLDGDYEEIIVEWWALSGSFLRTAYNRRTTCTTYRFESVGTEAYRTMERMTGR